MTFILSFILAGLALQVAARFWPVREFQHDIEPALDVIALVVALVSQVAVAAVAIPAISSIQHYEVVSSSYHYLLTLPPLAAGIFYFVVVDFVAYWMHRLNHAGWLWHTHAFHHSARNLYWASGMRGSPVHFVLLGVPSLLVQVVFSPEGPVLALVTAYGVLHNSLIHSNVRIPTRALNWVFVTGESHFVHHASDHRLANSNFGFLFTFWDRMFATRVEPDEATRNRPLGLDYEVDPVRLVLGLAPGRPRSLPEPSAPLS